MAKVTKVAPKRSVSITGKKKGFLGRNFNLQSRKVQFFVVILIVAILGGGYYTYKSFAATATWTVAGANMSVGASPGCSSTKETDPNGGKANIVVAILRCPQNVSSAHGATAGYASLSPLDSNFTLYSNYRTCVTARGIGSIRVSLSQSANTSNTSFPLTGSYKTFCGPTVRITSSNPIPNGSASVGAGSGAFVSLISVEKVDTPTNSVTPTK